MQAHNPEINWETGEVKMMRCPTLCGRNTKLEKGQKAKKGKRVVMLEEEKIVRWTMEDKEDWCYESPKKEQVSHAFKHLVANIKLYNADKI